MSFRGGGHLIFSLHLGVGHSVLCQIEGVGHLFSNHHISKCFGSPHPVLFDQSLIITLTTLLGLLFYFIFLQAKALQKRFREFEELVVFDLWIPDKGIWFLVSEFRFPIPDSGFRFPGFRVVLLKILLLL